MTKKIKRNIRHKVTTNMRIYATHKKNIHVNSTIQTKNTNEYILLHHINKSINRDINLLIRKKIVKQKKIKRWIYHTYQQQ